MFGMTAAFVASYQLFVNPKSRSAGLRFGVLIGLLIGLTAGFGAYLRMPIPQVLAWGWFLDGCLKGLTAGVLVGHFLSDGLKVRERFTNCSVNQLAGAASVART